MAYDADIFRAFLEIFTVLTAPSEVLARPGLLDRIMTIAQNHDPLTIPGPTRQEPVELVG